MWNWRSGALFAIAAGAVLACGSGDKTGPSVASLVGTWRATKAEVVSVANPSTKVELVALGGSVRLVLTEAKTFTLTQTMPGAADDVTTGTWSSSIDMLSLVHAYGTWECDMALTGNTLSLGGADTDYDFNGDDVEEPAKWYLTLVRVQ